MSTPQIQMWANPRRILLATALIDLKFTLPVAIQQALTYKAELLIAHVLPDENRSNVDPVLMVHADSDRLRKSAEKELEHAVAQAAAVGVPCSFHLVYGDVVAEMIKIATLWNADRLVAGSHGKSRFHRHILGSAAESIFHLIEIPVLAVGPKSAFRTIDENNRMRIVFATSLDYGAKRMAEFALNVAEIHQADIWMLHVIANVVPEHPTAVPVRTYATRMMQDLVKSATIGKCHPVCEVVYGQPVESILASAAKHAADMIVMGASAHAAFDARFAPGTAYRVLCDSPRPVLVLKQESAWIQSGAVAQK